MGIFGFGVARELELLILYIFVEKSYRVDHLKSTSRSFIHSILIDVQVKVRQNTVKLNEVRKNSKT